MRRLLPFVLLLAGCDFYFGNGDDACEVAVDDGYAVVELRNPETGECQEFRQGGSYCPDGCGPCATIDIAPLPSWGACTSRCSDLTEEACLDAEGCHASYDEDGSILDAPSTTRFTGCWAVAPGPLPDSSCWERDAHACASDDTCASYYTIAGWEDPSTVTSSSFSRCAPEPSANGCEDVACGLGSHCELQCAPCADPSQMCPCGPTCVPDYDTCATIDCGAGYTCVETCSGSGPSGGAAMPPAQCKAECVWSGGGDPGECTGDVFCLAMAPACPTGTVPGIASGCWTGYCIPEAACGPNEPGGCEPATCTTPGPACPSGTVGGTRNGCWTGYCIPESSCPVAACEQLTTEAACEARTDCQAIYTGATCTCDPGCTCEELTFDRCSALPMPF